MRKISYPDKTNSDTAPVNQKTFMATEANEIKEVVNHNATDEIPFNSVVNLDKNYVSEHLITGPIHYTFDMTQQPSLGSRRTDYVTADGINKPTFDASFSFRYDGYLNEQNRVNRILLEYVGGGKVLVDMVYV